MSFKALLWKSSDQSDEMVHSPQDEGFMLFTLSLVAPAERGAPSRAVWVLARVNSYPARGQRNGCVVA
jgi:hypothetical protein